MKTFIVAALVITLVFSSNFFDPSRADAPGNPDLVLIASTPADSLVRAQLGIDRGTAVDFIRWDLSLMEEDETKGTYVLNIHYGVGKPNTNGFMKGGEKATIQGAYRVSGLKNLSTTSSVYRFENKKAGSNFSIIKISDNVFQLLGFDNKLKRGTSGWSYTFNNRYPLETSTTLSSRDPILITGDKSSEMVFEGRTPCGRLPKVYDMKSPKECYKIKWLLTLRKDPLTFAPTTYSFKRVPGSPTESTGKWLITKGPEAIFYELLPDDKKTTITFLAADENVIFFLDDNKQIFVGNDDFSYSLNRRIIKE
jgi:hypothetical protein